MFRMDVFLENAADCEIRSVIRYLNFKKVKPAEIYREIVSVYGPNVMSEGKVRKWCRMFNSGRTNTHDESRSGRPTLINENTKTEIDDYVKRNRRFTLDELSEKLPLISRSLIHEIITKHLGYRKICARWVPRLLGDNHKQQRMAAALNFLEGYDINGDALLDNVVTGDETWICYFTPEMKRQSMEWHHANSPSKPKKCKQIPSSRKLMATVFWDRHGVILCEFMPRGETINANSYCLTLKRLRRAIQNRRRGLLSRGVWLFHDNARPHAANDTRELIESFGWDVFDHPPYSPDLAPSDYYLFPKLKEFLSGVRMESDEELKGTVNTWFKNMAANFYDEGIKKLVDRYDKCLNLNGNYVEK